MCWGGVYLGCRTFLPMLIAADEAHIVNTSSVNGFWASLGPARPHTAYSAAKFAVKGFTEALITDLRLNAPHVRASVVMPGHIGTGIVLNSFRYFGLDPKHLDAEQLAQVRARLASQGIDASGASDEDLRNGMQLQGEMFRDQAPTTAAQAATIILEGVRADRWRILVGTDAEQLDRMVRETPEDAYEPSFMEQVRAAGSLRSDAAVADHSASPNADRVATARRRSPSFLTSASRSAGSSTTIVELGCEQGDDGDQPRPRIRADQHPAAGVVDGFDLGVRVADEAAHRRVGSASR